MSISGWPSPGPAPRSALRRVGEERNGARSSWRCGLPHQSEIWGRQRGCATASKDLEGEPSPGRTGPLPTPARVRRSPDSAAEQGLEGGACRESGRPNTREATATVTWCGCRRGSSFEGYETDVAGKATIGSGSRLSGRFFESAATETQRTPGSAAGRNKPAKRPEEEAAEVVKNHEGGTSGGGWHPLRRSGVARLRGSGLRARCR